MGLLDGLKAFEGLSGRKDDTARTQKMLRQALHADMNYWDYLIMRIAERPQDLEALRDSTKTDIALIFMNRFI